MADFYESVLTLVSAQACSGDIIGGPGNLVLQSENFGTTWVADGTPVRGAGDITVGSVTLDSLADDAAGALEGYHQNIAFTGNAVKAISLFTRQISATSSGIRLRDNTAGTDRLLAALTWSGGLPVLTMSAGTDLGYETVGSGVFRLKMATTSVTAANTNELGIYPATVVPLAAGGTGATDFGGVQAEDVSTPGSYVKTTTAVVTPTTLSCCSELTGWAPVRLGVGHRVVLDFVLHEV